MPIVLAVNVPDINPNYSAPFFGGFQLIVSYVLGAAILIAFTMLITAAGALTLRGVGNERVRTWAGENILWIFVATALLGAIGGAFQWFINFDLGF